MAASPTANSAIACHSGRVGQRWATNHSMLPILLAKPTVMATTNSRRMKSILCSIPTREAMLDFHQGCAAARLPGTPMELDVFSFLSSCEPPDRKRCCCALALAQPERDRYAEAYPSGNSKIRRLACRSSLEYPKALRATNMGFLSYSDRRVITPVRRFPVAGLISRTMKKTSLPSFTPSTTSALVMTKTISLSPGGVAVPVPSALTL